MEGVDGAASAWVADGCNRLPGREFSPEGEDQHAELVQAAKIGGLGEWRKFDVLRAAERL